MQKIADDLGIHEKTVEKYLQAARGKLRARTTAHAISIAIGLGLIEPCPLPLGSPQRAKKPKNGL